MTDTIENENTPTVGDKGTIGRGRHVGADVTVLAVNGEELAVQLDGGTFTVIKATNFRTPAPKTVTVAAVVEALNSGTIVDFLNGIVPGAGDDVKDVLEDGLPSLA